MEKVKKLGGFTTFNMYIMKELETMYRLLTEIKTTLTVSIQNVHFSELENFKPICSLGDKIFT